MQGNPRIVELLNDYLTKEFTASNTYFAHSRMCANWGYARLAEKFREIAFEEMRDMEQIIDRVLFFDGVPNLQRIGSVVLGETVPEQLEISLGLEHDILGWMTDAIRTCVEEGDEGTREFIAGHIADEEDHLDWVEAQLGLVEQLGEAHYLAQQVRE